MAASVKRAPAFPRKVERTYRNRLQRRNLARHRRLMAALAPMLARFREDIDRTGLGEEGFRSDADPTDVLARLLRVVVLASISFEDDEEPDPDDLEGLGRQLDLFAARQVERIIPITRLGLPDETDLVKGWARDNVKLIKSIDARYFSEIEKLIRDGFREGTTTAELAAGIRQRFEVSRSRAKLIARDQVATLNSKATEAKQRRLGVTHYIWRTSQDERVRDEHEEREGVAFSWDEPPADGAPGEAIACRCTAEPLLPGESFA